MARWEIVLDDHVPVTAIRRSDAGEVQGPVEHPMTVLDVAKRTRRSRRQVYRDLRAGRIRPFGKFLGEWLIDPRELARLWPPPKSLASLLPEYDLASLDLDHHADLLLSRICRF